MFREEIEIRIDDVLLYQTLTSTMARALKDRGSWFEQFKEFDKFFEKHKIKTILAILTDGIEQYPEWIEYIKKNKERYQIEIHGHKHMNYRNQSAEFGYNNLRNAKHAITETFGIEPTTWYVPFAIRGYPDWGKEVCKELGLKFNKALDENKKHYRCHYWNPRDVKRIKGIAKYYYGLEC